MTAQCPNVASGASLAGPQNNKNCCHLTSHGLKQLEASNNYSADGYKLFIMQSSLYLHIVFIIVYAPRIKKSIMIPQDTYHVKIREVSSIAGEPSYLLVI